jgi:2-hydroxychromene-2-carboxylate isomerase
MHRSLDFYFDFISPFGYLASLRVDELATRHQRECRWQSMLLGISVLKIMGMQPLAQIPLKGDYLASILLSGQHKLTLARTRDMTLEPDPRRRAFHGSISDRRSPRRWPRQSSMRTGARAKTLVHRRR